MMTYSVPWQNASWILKNEMAIIELLKNMIRRIELELLD